MLKSCSKCGKLHPKGYVCNVGEPTEQQRRAQTAATLFRNKSVWRRKAKQIRERDMQMCQCCCNGIRTPSIQYNSKSLSVHHIRPLETNYELRLDDDNLITLCSYHHDLAERGIISAKILRGLIKTLKSS